MVKDRHTIQKTLWLLIGMLIWEAVVRLGLVHPLLLPAFSDVVIELISGLFRGTLLIQLLQSLGLVFAGALAGLLAAFLMATLGYFSERFSSLFDAYSAVLHPLPGVALLPVVILWFGIGGGAVFAVIFHAVVWSQYLTIRMGYNQVDISYIEAAHNNGANRLQLVTHVLVPLSYRAILNGIQVGWSRGWRALISAEMIFGAISGIGGIGWYMYERRAFMDTTGTFAGILLVALVGILMEQLIFSRLLTGLNDIS